MTENMSAEVMLVTLASWGVGYLFLLYVIWKVIRS